MTHSEKIQGISLHIGCGLNYHVGSLNVDLFDFRIADIGAHAAFLPFKSDIIGMIEAYHLLEHFDWVEVKYLLNEWFRVLKEGGSLIIEVPDLKASSRKLSRLRDLSSQTATLQWIYGIQDPGMRHKTGFTREILFNFLLKVGFVEVRKETPQSHQYEKGLRIACKKPFHNKIQDKTLIHAFRTNITPIIFSGHMKSIHLLEKNHIEIIESLLIEKKNINMVNNYIRALSILSICNPLLAEILLQIITNCTHFLDKYQTRIKTVIEFLNTINFHQKVFTLWVMRKKTPGELEKDYQSFMVDLESKLFQSFTSDSDLKKTFSYTCSMSSESIPFFDSFFIMNKATACFNQGLQKFSLGRFEEAKDRFIVASSLNSDNYVIYWNLGRLGILTDDPETTYFYQTALSLSSSKADKKEILKELHGIKESVRGIVIDTPVFR
ncbi:MAG: hypothetical protein ACXADY_24895 [Candidatus Hodarchaeales archaeon]|jgi:predicted SAM-dependent methyltransferase